MNKYREAQGKETEWEENLERWVKLKYSHKSSGRNLKQGWWAADILVIEKKSGKKNLK